MSGMVLSHQADLFKNDECILSRVYSSDTRFEHHTTEGSAYTELRPVITLYTDLASALAAEHEVINAAIIRGYGLCTTSATLHIETERSYPLISEDQSTEIDLAAAMILVRDESMLAQKVNNQVYGVLKAIYSHTYAFCPLGKLRRNIQAQQITQALMQQRQIDTNISMQWLVQMNSDKCVTVLGMMSEPSKITTNEQSALMADAFIKSSDFESKVRKSESGYCRFEKESLLRDSIKYKSTLLFRKKQDAVEPSNFLKDTFQFSGAKAHVQQ